MKIVLIVGILFLSLGALGKEVGLPNEPDTTTVNLAKIPQTKSMTLKYALSLPGPQQLNKGAPSFVAIYEKMKGENWTETQRLPLSEFFNIGAGMNFSKNIQLRHTDSDVAIYSTIFHCGKERKTLCYIQGFQGIIKRNSKTQDQAIVDFSIAGTLRE